MAANVLNSPQAVQNDEAEQDHLIQPSAEKEAICVNSRLFAVNVQPKFPKKSIDLGGLFVSFTPP